MKIPATELRKQTTLARRTVTSILNLSRVMAAHGKVIPELGALSPNEQLQLNKAIEVISKISGKYASISKKTKAQEINEQAMYEKAVKDAKVILTSWDTASSPESKITIIMGDLGMTALKRELEDPDCSARELERMYNNSLEQFATYAAYRVTEANPITKVLDRAFAQFKINSASAEVVSLAKLWKAKI